MTTRGSGRAARPPKIIHQFWDRQDVPEDVGRRIASWRDQHPGWAHILWHDDSTESLIMAHFGAEAARRFRACTIASMRSDVLRMAALLLFGGVYADADIKCLRPIDPLMDARLVVRLQHPADGSFLLHTHFLIAEPRHRLFELAWKEMMARILRSGRKRWPLIRGTPLNDVSTVTGPHMLTAAWLKMTDAKRTEARVIDDEEAARFLKPTSKLDYRAAEGSWKTQMKSQRIVDFERAGPATPGGSSGGD